MKFPLEKKVLRVSNFWIKFVNFHFWGFLFIGKKIFFFFCKRSASVETSKHGRKRERVSEREEGGSVLKWGYVKVLIIKNPINPKNNKNLKKWINVRNNYLDCDLKTVGRQTLNIKIFTTIFHTPNLTVIDKQLVFSVTIICYLHPNNIAALIIYFLINSFLSSEMSFSCTSNLLYKHHIRHKLRDGKSTSTQEIYIYTHMCFLIFTIWYNLLIHSFTVGAEGVKFIFQRPLWATSFTIWELWFSAEMSRSEVIRN